MNESQKKIEVKIGGFGGQGIILAGHIVGKSAAIYDNKHSCFIKSYGPEARGGACNIQITISDSQILYPYVIVPDALMVLSQEAYNKFCNEMNSDSVLLYEKDLVKLYTEPVTDKVFSIPATQIAEHLGRRVVTNIVMLGFFVAITKAVSKDALRKGIESTVPKGTTALNLRAFEEGYSYGLSELEKYPDFIPPGNRFA